MQAIEYRTQDKSTWGDGPWQQEPDKVQFQDEATGLPCLIVRNHNGALCGYVGVAEGHPLFGKSYDTDETEGRGASIEKLAVHGGITFGNFCQPITDEGDEARYICHIPGPGEPDKVWWLGFDCGHGFDVCPALDVHMPKALKALLHAPDWAREPTYKSLDYVKGQIASLAEQIKGMA